MDPTTPPLDAARRSALRHHLEREAALTLRRAPHRPAVRRLAVVGAGALGLAGALVLAPARPGEQPAPLAPAVAAAGVTFTPDGEGVVAEITDPEASAAAMTAAFAEQGYDITVTLVPADPELVGTVVMTSTSDWREGDIEEAGVREGCSTPGGGEDSCTTAVRVPAGFAAEGEVSIGREPAPGEATIAEQSSS